MDSAFLVTLLTACRFFRLQLPFKCINYFKKEKEGQRLLSGSSFGLKDSLFLLFKFGNCSAISRVVVVLVTIVTPHVGPVKILRRLAYTTGSEEGLGPLVRLIFSVGSYMGIMFSISWEAITHLIQSSGHPSLKIANFREYLDPQAGLSGSMRNSNLIHSDLTASGPSTLSTFFTLEIKGMGGGVLVHRRRQSIGGFGKLTHGHCLD
jgi:hypothetical protein